jgi:2-dehydro-3-deoxygluconokinase
MKVVTFGEIMLHLAPQGYLRFQQANTFEATYGGGEANVAVSLSNFGVSSVFVTKLVNHDIGQCAINDLRRYGVDTNFIERGGERIGIYYIEKGASQRASQVIYDRANSSIAAVASKDFDWKEIFKDVTWFHFTGITPALGENVAEICEEACVVAKEQGITISCDLNFRKKLWSSEEANKTMSNLMQYVDVCIANEEDAANVFNIHAKNSDIEKGILNHEAYIDVAKQLEERFNFKSIAITLRESISASTNKWSAMLYQNGEAYFSKTYTIQIVDRVGGGDSFGAGLIYSALHRKSPQEAIEFAVAASCLKHTVEGDYNRVTVGEVEALLAGDGSGRVQR